MSEQKPKAKTHKCRATYARRLRAECPNKSQTQNDKRTTPRGRGVVDPSRGVPRRRVDAREVTGARRRRVFVFRRAASRVDARDGGARARRATAMTAVTARGDARRVGTATRAGDARRDARRRRRFARRRRRRRARSRARIAWRSSGAGVNRERRSGAARKTTRRGEARARGGGRARERGGRTGDDALSRRAGRRGTARADGAEDARGTRRRRARCARVRYRRAGGASARTDDETDDDAGSGRSTKSLGTTRRPSEGWIIQSCGTS